MRWVVGCCCNESGSRYSAMKHLRQGHRKEFPLATSKENFVSSSQLLSCCRSVPLRAVTAASQVSLAVRAMAGLLGFLFFTSPVTAITPPMGVAPTLVPAGGFAIEGNLLANTPTNGVGDWIFRTNNPGAGGGVLTTN